MKTTLLDYNKGSNEGALNLPNEFATLYLFNKDKTNYRKLA